MYQILAIDDDEIMQKILRDILRPEGFDFRVCSDGSGAVAAAKSEKPDLILLDVQLPGISGFEVCRALKADDKTKHIPVIMLTGEAREVAMRVEGLEGGAEDYLFKPVSPRVLISRVKQLLKVSAKPTR